MIEIAEGWDIEEETKQKIVLLRAEFDRGRAEGKVKGRAERGKEILELIDKDIKEYEDCLPEYSNSLKGLRQQIDKGDKTE